MKFAKKIFKPSSKKFRRPRKWSNKELRKYAHIFTGDIINVSGWKDIDKEGKRYKEYFQNATKYWVSNYSDSKGVQNIENEIFLDLEKPISSDMYMRYDVVFNHTVLEHIFNCRTAFANLCKISKDVVIVVVPYIQQVHGIGYGDFWRFTPHTMKRLYEENDLILRYCSANGRDKASIYLFCIGYRDQKWNEYIPERFDLKIKQNKPLYGRSEKNIIGGNVI